MALVPSDTQILINGGTNPYINGSPDIIFGKYVFRLRANVYVYSDYKSGNFMYDTDFITLKSYDITNINNKLVNDNSERSFIGVGYPSYNDTLKGPQKTNKTNYDLNDDSNNISWGIQTDYQETTGSRNNGLLITYQREGMDKPMKLWTCLSVPWICEADYDDATKTYKNYFYLYDPETEDAFKPSGCIVFYSKVPVASTNLGMEFTKWSGVTDPSQTPFHIEATNGASPSLSGRYYYLCFNTNESVFQDLSNFTLLWNGSDWNCSIYIFDSGHPYFKDKNIAWKTLELPSVYKPFYMRALVLIEPKKETDENSVEYPVYVTGNVFNGIGVMDDGKYNIGTLTVKINDIVDNIEITGMTPTLLSTYEESIHTFNTFTKDGVLKNHLEGAVLELDGISVDIAITENAPPSAVFNPNKITYQDNVSFYDIEFTVTYDAIPPYSKQYFNIKHYNGTSSAGVQYFFVSRYFYEKFIKRMTSLDTPTSYLECNTRQYYELYPHKLHNDTTQFCGLYGVYETSYSYYPNSAYRSMDPRNNLIAVRLNDINRYEFELNRQNNIQPAWVLIGIYDPYVSLIGTEGNLFNEEYQNGNVLVPHTNFITVMKYYTPSN